MPRPRASRRMAAVQAPIVPLIGDLIHDNPGTVSLAQGVVFYGPPPEALRAIDEFKREGDHHQYGPVQGLPPLIELIEAKLASENGIRCGPGASRVVVTAGANMGFLNTMFAITDPGDQIILPLPYYFNHEMAIRMLNCRPVCVPTDPDYQLQIDRLEGAITDRTRAIVTISPNNPSGAVYPRNALVEVNQLCARYGLYHICDEAYEYFIYGDTRGFSPGGLDGAHAYTISLYSLSKAYGAAGWRIGYMALPEQLYEAVLKAQDTNLICASRIAQHAAIKILEIGSAYCRERITSIRTVRASVLDALDPIRYFCRIPRAEGAFYLLMCVDTELDPMTVVRRLIIDHGIAVLPGTAFGLDQGCYLRLSYGSLGARSVTEGISRLVSGLQEIVQGIAGQKVLNC